MPKADINGLFGVAIEVQDGGTDSGPSVAALPRPAEAAPSAPPRPEMPEAAGSPSPPVPTPAAIPAGAIASAPLIPVPVNVEPVMACTTWAGLNAPVDVRVFQKFESTPKTALLLLPRPVSVPPPVTLLSMLDSHVEVAVDDVPADVPLAALTVADWLANPAALVV